MYFNKSKIKVKILLISKIRKINRIRSKIKTNHAWILAIIYLFSK